MKASLDTNVIIHLYKSGTQNMLFEMFDQEIYIDEFIYNVELKKHGQEILSELDDDIEKNKIKIMSKVQLKNMRVLELYNEYLLEEEKLYSRADAGEMHAVALARSLGAISVVTDDTKEFGPHFTLMREPDSDIIPLTFYEILLLLYIRGVYSIEETVKIFDRVIDSSPELPFELISKIKSFVKRFEKGEYNDRDNVWLAKMCEKYNVSCKGKLKELYLSCR